MNQPGSAASKATASPSSHQPETAADNVNYGNAVSKPVWPPKPRPSTKNENKESMLERYIYDTSSVTDRLHQVSNYTQETYKQVEETVTKGVKE